jgi:hypothetical protein
MGFRCVDHERKPRRLLSLTTTIILSGSIAAITLVGVPAAVSVQQSSAQIWRGMFLHGKATMPPIAVTIALSYAYAAYETRSRGGNWKGFLAAAGLVVSIVPFTLLFMSTTNDALLSAASGAAALGEAPVSELIKRWGVLNLTRSALPLLGAILGVTTFLSNTT